MPEFTGLGEHQATKKHKESYSDTGVLESEHRRTKDGNAQFQPEAVGTYQQSCNGTSDDYKYRRIYDITTWTHYQWSDFDPVVTCQQETSSSPDFR